MALALVTPREPTPTEAAIEHIKARFLPDGMIQCKRCGCRAVLTVTVGATIINGRYHRGKVTDDRVCAECWKRGIFSPMMPPRMETVKP